MIFIGEHGTHLNPSTIPGTHNSGYAPVTPVTVLRPESMARSMGSLRLPQRALVMPTVQGSQHTINPMHVRMLDNEARARALPSPRVAPPVRWLSGGLADLSQTTMILAPESAKTPIGPPAQPQQLPGREPPPEPPPEQPPEQPPEPPPEPQQLPEPIDVGGATQRCEGFCSRDGRHALVNSRSHTRLVSPAARVLPTR